MKQKSLILISLLLLIDQWSLNNGHSGAVVVVVDGGVSAWKPQSYCHSPSNGRFDNITEFTNAMCTYCLWTIYTESTYYVWRNGYDFNRLLFVDQSFSSNSIVVKENSTHAYYYDVDYDHFKQLRTLRQYNNDPILKDLANELFVDKILQCCQDAHDCCQRMLNTTIDDNHIGQCPMIWDGWSCWDPTEPNTIGKNICPDMSLLAFEDYYDNIPSCVRSNAMKTCQTNGTWIQHTDYGECSILGRYTREIAVKSRIILQSISILLSIIAIIIFIYLRLYVKFYIQLLLNFFLSIILSSTISLLYDIYVTKGHIEFSENTILQNPNYCRTFTFFYKETRMMNYAWMLIEGIFLHNSAVFAFNCRKMTEWRRTIYFFGWILPNIIMIIYGIIRLKYTESFDRCWTDSIGNLEWIFLFFPYLCFVVNLLLYINLIRIILIKLVFVKNGQMDCTGIKLALMLMPIFGIQYAIHMIIIDPTQTCQTFLLTLFHLQNMIESLQGTIITFILCFLNKDVYKTISNSIRKHNNRRKSKLSTFITTMNDSAKQMENSPSLSS
uniref:Calcitonin gene-related peptide type 1 receptor-like n=1 Tax=Dermatophagoides pteronyssinus TaxID=6956 RepID=A0A6P6YKD5_DERPT|nr:calcitonin gene-related peptide type 1 receptor-like [Dermatophagoides pteronyssinus]